MLNVFDAGSELGYRLLNLCPITDFAADSVLDDGRRVMTTSLPAFFVNGDILTDKVADCFSCQEENNFPQTSSYENIVGANLRSIYSSYDITKSNFDDLVGTETEHEVILDSNPFLNILLMSRSGNLAFGRTDDGLMDAIDVPEGTVLRRLIDQFGPSEKECKVRMRPVQTTPDYEGKVVFCEWKADGAYNRTLRTFSGEDLDDATYKEFLSAFVVVDNLPAGYAGEKKQLPDGKFIILSPYADQKNFIIRQLMDVDLNISPDVQTPLERLVRSIYMTGDGSKLHIDTKPIYGDSARLDTLLSDRSYCGDLFVKSSKDLKPSAIHYTDLKAPRGIMSAVGLFKINAFTAKHSYAYNYISTKGSLALKDEMIINDDLRSKLESMDREVKGETIIGIGYDYHKHSFEVMVPASILGVISAVNVPKVDADTAVSLGIIKSVDQMPDGDFVLISRASYPSSLASKFNLGAYLSPAYLSSVGKSDIEPSMKQFGADAIHVGRASTTFKSLGSFLAFDVDPLDDLSKLLSNYNCFAPSDVILRSLAAVEATSLCPDVVEVEGRIYKDESILKVLSGEGFIPRLAQLSAIKPRSYSVTVKRMSGSTSVTVMYNNKTAVITNKRENVSEETITTDGSYILLLLVMGAARTIMESAAITGEHLSLRHINSQSLAFTLPSSFPLTPRAILTSGIEIFSQDPVALAKEVYSNLAI